MDFKILVSITTTWQADWRGQIKEIKKLGLKEICLFPTCLKEKERKEMYDLVEKAGIKQVPLVHIRNDLLPAEMNFLLEKFHVRAFCTHTHFEFPFLFEYPAYLKKMIFIENIYQPLNETEIKQFGGICLDISHLENDKKLHPEKFKQNVSLLEKYPIGCNHISCFAKTSYRDATGDLRYDSHIFKDIRDFDYLKTYPQKYFSDINIIELENSLEDQLKVRDYIRQNYLKMAK